MQETGDGVIQVLGARRSRLSTHDANALQNIPRYVVAYVHAVAHNNGIDPRTLERDVMDYLDGCGVLSPSQLGVLFAERTCLVRPGELCFACPQCRRLHLHRAGGVCIDCLVPLDPPRPVATAASTNDYYNFLATQAGELFRLNCEELTGQTDKADARNRQRLFQGICLPRPTERAAYRRSGPAERNYHDGSGSRYWVASCSDDGQHAAHAIQLSATNWPRWPPWRRPRGGADALPRAQP